MTPLFAHTVAQPTKCRFVSKKLNQQSIFWNEIAFTWSWVEKYHQMLILIFYVKNQLKIILIFFVKIIQLGEHLKVISFLDNFLFWNSFSSKTEQFFCRLEIKQTQVQPKKYLAGSTFEAKIYIWLAVQLCASIVRSY